MIEIETGTELTETGNARRLVRDHGRDVRYSPGLGWHVWDCRRLQLDKTGEMSRRAQQTIDQIELVELRAAEDAKTSKALWKHIQSSRTARAYRSMLEIASSDLRVLAPPETLDANPTLLNVSNGTLDVTTGTLRPPDPADLITKLADVQYDPEATCPKWEAFLEWILPDAQVRRFVQMVIGSILTDEPRPQLLVVMSGLGANGKTTVLETIAAVMGDYAVQLPDAMLLARRNASGAAEPELLTLRGGRFIAGVESGEGRSLDEVRVKRLTGGDTISARALYSSAYIKVTPRGHIFYATNHKPDVKAWITGCGGAWQSCRSRCRFPRADGIPNGVRGCSPPNAAASSTGSGGYRGGKLRASRDPSRGCSGCRIPVRHGRLGAFLAERCVHEATAETPLTRPGASVQRVGERCPRAEAPSRSSSGRTSAAAATQSKRSGTGSTEARKQGRVVEGLRLVEETLVSTRVAAHSPNWPARPPRWRQLAVQRIRSGVDAAARCSPPRLRHRPTRLHIYICWRCFENGCQAPLFNLVDTRPSCEPSPHTSVGDGAAARATRRPARPTCPPCRRTRRTARAAPGVDDDPEAAAYAGVSPQTIRQLRRSGRLSSLVSAAAPRQPSELDQLIQSGGLA